MARKKQETALQVEIETQEEWEEMLAKEGLTIVDIYQEWCGPCKAMVSIFRRIKNEIGDDLLHFAVAKSDTVDALERYRGKCKPCFLFFAGGVLVSVIRGANSPLITKTITEQLNQEHKVLDGNAERKEIRDLEIGDDDREKGAEDEDETESDQVDEVGLKVSGVDTLAFDSHERSLSPGLKGMRHQGELVMYDSLPETAGAEGQKKGVTVAIIKPDVVAAGKVDEILEQMKERGIEILEQQEKQLTEEEAREFYGHKQDEEFFEDLVKFMSSGPSVVLVLTKGETGEGIIEEWRSLLGPASVEEAKEQAPDSLRAKYGSEKFENAVHGSDTTDTAMKELAFFFPGFNVPTVPTAQRAPSAKKIQRTLALIRPDALRERKEEILQKIEESGFTVAMQKEMHLTKEQAEDFYKEHRGEAYFEELTTSMSSGPLLALALAREDAVSGWREKLGPKELEKAKEEAPDSFRAQFAVDDVQVNQLHGSDSPATAQQELEYFFPKEQTVAVIKPDAFQTKEEIMSKIREAGFHIAARKETQLTREIAEQFYKEHQDKEYFGDLTEHMTSGPTLFMVLSREDAVHGWRSLMGPPDPEAAKESAADSLRAQYGTDVKANALHGSSTVEQAQESIRIVFGDEVEYNEDGTIKEPEPQEEQQQQEEEDANKSEEEKAENESLEKGDEEGEATEEQKPTEEQTVEGDSQEKQDEADADKQDDQVTDKQDEQTTDTQDEPTTDKQDEPTTDKQDELATDNQDEPATDKQDEPATDKQDEPAKDTEQVEQSAEEHTEAEGEEVKKDAEAEEQEPVGEKQEEQGEQTTEGVDGGEAKEEGEQQEVQVEKAEEPGAQEEPAVEQTNEEKDEGKEPGETPQQDYQTEQQEEQTVEGEGDQKESVEQEQKPEPTEQQEEQGDVVQEEQVEKKEEQSEEIEQDVANKTDAADVNDKPAEQAEENEAPSDKCDGDQGKEDTEGTAKVEEQKDDAPQGDNTEGEHEVDSKEETSQKTEEQTEGATETPGESNEQKDGETLQTEETKDGDGQKEQEGESTEAPKPATPEEEKDDQKPTETSEDKPATPDAQPAAESDDKPSTPAAEGGDKPATPTAEGESQPTSDGKAATPPPDETTKE